MDPDDEVITWECLFSREELEEIAFRVDLPFETVRGWALGGPTPAAEHHRICAVAAALPRKG
jgi:hypothetical protein